MQAVYFPCAGTLSVEKGQEFVLHSHHDEYSLWFDVSPVDT